MKIVAVYVCLYWHVLVKCYCRCQIDTCAAPQGDRPCDRVREPQSSGDFATAWMTGWVSP